MIANCHVSTTERIDESIRASGTVLSSAQQNNEQMHVGANSPDYYPVVVSSYSTCKSLDRALFQQRILDCVVEFKRSLLKIALSL